MTELKTYDTEEEAMENGLIDYGFQEEFDGKNCHDANEDECGGWDGESRRCECGNRRVYWAPHEDENGKFFVIAEAW